MHILSHVSTKIGTLKRKYEDRCTGAIIAVIAAIITAFMHTNDTRWYDTTQHNIQHRRKPRRSSGPHPIHCTTSALES